MSLATTERMQSAPANITIREFSGSDADYAAAVAIVNAVFPEYADTVEEWRFGDANHPQHLKRRRWLADLDGEAMGFGDYDQHAGMFHPRKFGVFVAVRPEAQGRGVGRALYETIVAALGEHEPISLRARTRADMERGYRFLLDRGFVEDMREWESRLDVPSFDASPYAGHDERVRASGVELLTLAELMERDPDHRRRLYELDLDLSRDVPHPEPQTPIERELFEKYVFENPNRLPEGYFVALVDGEYAGLSALWTSQTDPSFLYTGLTGVRRAYRRRGIALALKLRAIAYAKRQGIQTLKTWNESNNRAMLSINEALGFVKQPAWINFAKKLSDEA